MIKIVLGSLVVASTLFSYEITMTKEFVKELKPNSLSVLVNISTIQKSAKDALDKLNGYSQFIKSFKDLTIKGGTFNTHPEYRYYNSKREMIGYRANINYQVSSNDEEKLKDFITMLTAKNSEKDIALSIGSGSWRVDEDSIKQMQDELKFKALEWADNYAVKLSDKTGKNCKIKSVDFSGGRYSPPIVYAKSRVASDKGVPMPQKSLQKIKIDTKLKFECK
jgi:uncharacterized protein YggE